MRVYLVLICVTLCVASFRRSDSAAPKDPFYGISPQDEGYYKTSSDSIKCKDGSKKFSKSQLNDDFCDCVDGTDEPGTSACPTGRFYCRNAGHLPQTLFASRVNDGICDCCDGSDEYDGQVKCPNTCWDAGKAAREKLKKKIATYQDGVTIRKKEVEQAKITLAKDEEELTKLKSEEKILKGLVEQLKERKEQIEKVEEKERLQKEKEEKEKKEAEEALRKESEPKVETSEVEKNSDSEEKPTESMHDEVIGTLDDDPSNENDAAVEVESHDTSELEESPLSGVELHAEESKEKAVPAKHEDDSTTVPEAGNDGSENTEELSREELGRRIASRWTGEKHDDGKDNSDEGHDEVPEQTHDEDNDGYAPDTDDEADKYDDTEKYDDVDDDVDDTYEEDSHDDHKTSYQSDADDDFSETSTTSLGTPSWLEKIQNAVRNILQVVNVFQTPVNISDAAYVRKEYDESSDKLSKLQSRISTLSKKLKLDFGPEKEFFSFYNRCFEGKENKYTYKVCPYKQASQVEGHSTTRLGNWDKFEDSYRTMLFSNGDHCWNGPDRSLKVRLRCGLKNEITDVDEPSRCEYVAILSTPALCTEGKLKELQNKLASMNEEQPEKHDEL